MPVDMSDTAVRKRRIFLEMNEETFMLWRHDPVTAAVLQMIEDQIASERDMIADVVESGLHAPGAPEEARNLDVCRGKIAAWRHLHNLTLMDIHRVYGEAAPFEEDLGQPFREDDE